MVYFGADDLKFYGVNAVTGEECWSFDLGPGTEFLIKLVQVLSKLY